MCRKLGENGVEHFFNKTLKTKFAYVTQILLISNYLMGFFHGKYKYE